MLHIKSLKNRLESLPKYIVKQEIDLPIYESSLAGIIDPESIKEKCLAIYETEEGDLNVKHFLKNSWKSPYYQKGSPNFEKFNDLAVALLNKLHSVEALRKSEMRFHVREFWIVIYTEGSEIHWHTHIPNVNGFTRLTGTYYPVASARAEPIEFQHSDGTISIPVTKDKVLIFPSMLHHRVPACVDSEPRIVVGFNFSGLY